MSKEKRTQNAEAEKTPPLAHLLCGWPLALVFIGGAVGGGLGGLAYGLNMAVYKSNLPIPAKAVLNLAIGAAAIGGWYLIALQLGKALN